MTPVGATLLTFLGQILGGSVTVTPAFSAGTGFGTTTVVASLPATVSGTITNNLATTTRPMTVTVTPATGTIAYGASADITSMDLVVNGASHTFVAGECTGGATLVCTTIVPETLVSGSNVIDVILTPNTLFDAAQSPLDVTATVN